MANSIREARKLMGHRLVLVKVGGAELIDLKVLCANTREWLDLQEACSKREFPGWAGKFWVLAPDLMVLSAQLIDIDAADLDASIDYKAATTKEREE